MIVAHIDLGDVTIAQTPPFDEAERNVFVMELVKFMLSSASFIVSCKDTDLVGSVFPPISETAGVDLTEGLNFVSTLDVVPTPGEPHREFILSFEGDEPQIGLSLKHFGGCAAYLETWAEINRCADHLEEAEQHKGDVEDARLFLNGLLEATLPQVLVDDDGKSFTRTVRSAIWMAAKP
jgi:hypothetical protein